MNYPVLPPQLTNQTSKSIYLNQDPCIKPGVRANSCIAGDDDEELLAAVAAVEPICPAPLLAAVDRDSKAHIPPQTQERNKPNLAIIWNESRDRGGCVSPDTSQHRTQRRRRCSVLALGLLVLLVLLLVLLLVVVFLFPPPPPPPPLLPPADDEVIVRSGIFLRISTSRFRRNNSERRSCPNPSQV